jgi:oxygen-independent coproporphyrinogen-3 oxidase
VISSGDHAAFIEAVGKESIFRKSYLSGETIKTVYLGGGTPSVLNSDEIGSMLDDLDKIFGMGSAEEITIEINPDDVTEIFLKSLKRLGINRISLGIQSWDDNDLKALNRRHTADQAREAIDMLFETGFLNVSADLIYGLPGMTTKKWTENLDIAFSTGITHLSAYHLTIEPDTVFGKMKAKGLLEDIDEEESASQFNALVDKAEEAGFIHYEISNFAKPGFISVHNTNYWKQVPYLGLGPSAHSFNGYSRQWNVSDIGKYIKRVSTGKDFYEREELNIKTRFNEYIMTSLRTMWGIDLEFVERNFEKEGYDYLINLSGKFISYGLMRKENNTLVLSNQGKMISDNIITEFMMSSSDK